MTACPLGLASQCYCANRVSSFRSRSARENRRASAGPRQPRESRPGSRVSKLCHRRTAAAASGGRRDPPSLFADRFLAAPLLDSFASRSTFAVVADAGLRRHAQLEALHRRCGESNCERATTSASSPSASRRRIRAPASASTAARLVGDGNLPFKMDFVDEWHDQPLLAKAFAEKLRAGWEKACAENGAKLPVIFTAHSVPAAHDHRRRSLREAIQGDRRVGSERSGPAQPTTGPSPSRAKACPAAHGSAPR